MALKTMTVAKLQDLKSQVEAAISTKVSERRHELESQLSKLDVHTGGARGEDRQDVVDPGERWLPNTATPRSRLRPGLAVVSGRGGWSPR
jgi:hypothetical protein